MANWWDEQLLQYQMALGQQKAGAGLQQRAQQQANLQQSAMQQGQLYGQHVQNLHEDELFERHESGRLAEQHLANLQEQQMAAFHAGVQQDRDTAQQMHEVVLNDLAHRGRIAEEEILQRHKRDELSQEHKWKVEAIKEQRQFEEDKETAEGLAAGKYVLNSEEDAKNFKDNLNKIGVIDQAYRSGKVSKEQHDEIVEKIRAANLDIQRNRRELSPMERAGSRGKIRQDLIDELPAEMRNNGWQLNKEGNALEMPRNYKTPAAGKAAAGGEKAPSLTQEASLREKIQKRRDALSKENLPNPAIPAGNAGSEKRSWAEWWSNVPETVKRTPEAVETQLKKEFGDHVWSSVMGGGQQQPAPGGQAAPAGQAVPSQQPPPQAAPAQQPAQQPQPQMTAIRVPQGATQEQVNAVWARLPVGGLLAYPDGHRYYKGPDGKFSEKPPQAAQPAAAPAGQPVSGGQAAPGPAPNQQAAAMPQSDAQKAMLAKATAFAQEYAQAKRDDPEKARQMFFSPDFAIYRDLLHGNR